jgi:hypothetical protein
MYTKQVSVFVENRKGRLAEITGLLAAEGISLRCSTLGDMADLGILRLLVDDHERCLKVLREHGFAAQETDVVAVAVEDTPGGLHQIVQVLGGAGLSIEYMYTFFGQNSDRAIVILRMDDAARAVQVLQDRGIPVLPHDWVRNLARKASGETRN